MTAITNKLNIKYKPWKISATKDNVKTIWAEISANDAEKRQESIAKDGWVDIRVIEGKEIVKEEE